jgi:hypothetical protein
MLAAATVLPGEQPESGSASGIPWIQMRFYRQHVVLTVGIAEFSLIRCYVRIPHSREIGISVKLVHRVTRPLISDHCLLESSKF